MSKLVPRVASLIRLSPVPVPHTNQAVYALAAARRFQELPASTLDAFASAAAAVAREPDSGAIRAILEERCRDALALTERYLTLVERRR